MKFEERNLEYREFVEAYLREIYQKYADQPQKPLFEAVEYSLLAAASGFVPFLPWISAGCAAVTGRLQFPLRRPLK